MELSLILPVYKKDELTVAHLRLAMDVSRVPDEIIVVNDGGNASLKDKLKDIPRKCPIVYANILKDITWNYNGACNLGVWLSRGKYLSFEDNDNIPGVSFYEDALSYFNEHPNIGRIQATKRKTVLMDDFLDKPRDEWTIVGQEGPNMGSAIIRRSVYLRLKGHDERFCGRYGFMYMDWRSRAIQMLGRENYTASVGEYFYTKEGQTSLGHSLTSENRAIYVENARAQRLQPVGGVLNFPFEYERWTPNS